MPFQLTRDPPLRFVQTDKLGRSTIIDRPKPCFKKPFASVLSVIVGETNQHGHEVVVCEDEPALRIRTTRRN